jgi:hypothetical protein
MSLQLSVLDDEPTYTVVLTRGIHHHSLQSRKTLTQNVQQHNLLDMEEPPTAASSPPAVLPPAAGTLARVVHGCPRLVPPARIVTAGLDDLMSGRLPQSCLLLDRSLSV